MNISKFDELSGEEEYANAYYRFVKTMNILKKDALEQCQEMGNYNVAWELRDDTLRGAEAVINLGDNNLNFEQQAAILSLVEDLKSVPEMIYMTPNLRDQQLAAMSNPAWDTIRDRAEALLNLLEPETGRVNSLLGLI